MASLRHADTRSVELFAHHLVGRSPNADLHLPDRRVSKQHATLRWTGRCWQLQDLGSRNGTFLDGRRLAAGERVALAAGARVSFGGLEDPWTLTDAGPPAAIALPLAGGERVPARDGILALPDPGAPRLTVFQGRDGQWRAEDNAGARAVVDEDTVEIGGRAWRLRLPEVDPLTFERPPEARTLERLRLHLSVARGGRLVEAEALFDDDRVDLESRAHHRLLLTLAEARLAEGDGWVDRAELLDALDTDEWQLNLLVFRARKQLAAAGVAGATGLVERRRVPLRQRRPGGDERQLRLGCEAVEVHRG